MKKVVEPANSKNRLEKHDYSGRNLLALDLQICSQCIYDETVPNIEFDDDGICNYCHQIEKIQDEYQTGTEQGKRTFEEIVEDMKAAGKGKKYDCVLGVSGGTDSSFLVYKAKEMGLRPLAVHYDNTWNTSIATQNIRKVLEALDVDLYTHVVDNKEIDDITHAFFKAGVPELDGPTDIALTEVLYRAAAEHNVDYILEGHSFRSEGISPLGTMYFDGAYIADIHQKYGEMEMETFPNMPFWRFMYWTIAKRIKKIRPLWYLDYSKEEAKEFLEDEFGWEYYGGHHLENRLTQFMHSVYTPVKFGIDHRHNSLSAKVRSGKMSRQDALEEYAKPPYVEKGLVEYFRKRLGISESEYLQTMNGPKRNFRDFKTYKERFERLRPMFYIMAKTNLVPQSFYEKYCFPLPEE